MPDVWETYCKEVQKDFKELKAAYPFSYLTIPLTCQPEPAVIRVVAANKALVDAIAGVEADFLEEYSRELYLIVPPDYQKRGCMVFGAKWLDLSKISAQDVHLNHHNNKFIERSYGFYLCVGTPESFNLLKNVILENVRTAEQMLIGYERIMRGCTKTFDVIAYTHGDAGRKQYKKNKNKFIS